MCSKATCSNKTSLSLAHNSRQRRRQLRSSGARQPRQRTGEVCRVVGPALPGRPQVAHRGGEGAAEVGGAGEGEVVFVVGDGGDEELDLPRRCASSLIKPECGNGTQNLTERLWINNMVNPPRNPFSTSSGIMMAIIPLSA